MNSRRIPAKFGRCQLTTISDSICLGTLGKRKSRFEMNFTNQVSSSPVALTAVMFTGFIVIGQRTEE